MSHIFSTKLDGTLRYFGGFYGLSASMLAQIATAITNAAAALAAVEVLSDVVGRGLVSILNKRMPARATSGNASRACDIAVAAAPMGGSRIFVEVNGLRVPELGDGSPINAACYFSRDSGSTAVVVTSIEAGDVLYWNGLIAGYDLATSDVIEFVYEVA